MKNALFLGGSKGLGLEMAKLALAEDWKVTLASRSAEEHPLHAEGRVGAISLNLEHPGIFLKSLHLYTDTHDPFDLIVWTAGAYQEGNILDQSPWAIERICRNHIEGPTTALIEILKKNRETATPCHLIVVASSGSYRVRKGEGLYGTLKAAKAQLARTLAVELSESIPGSKVLLAHPGGMNTPFWENRGRDVSTFMHPADVACLIWDEHKAQDAFFDEIHIDRQPDGSAKLDRGVRPPQF